MSRAWMPLYVADYIADTGHLTTTEHGAYLLLIMHYWSNGGLPDDERKLARIARMTHEQWLEVRDTIAELFQDEWRHKRIDAEFERASEKSSKASASANTRWMRTHSKRICDRNANAMLPQSQSQSDNINTIVNADAVDSPVSSFEKVKRVKDERNVDLIQTVVGDWNNLAANLKLPQVSHITPQRQSNILRRAKELVEYYDYAEPIAGFQDLFSKIRGSPFLRGDTGKFRADLDFAITLSSFTKIMENRYEALQPKTVYRK